MIQSVQKCIQIMEYIASNGNLVRLKDIADALDMKKTTAFNILATLQNLGYIEQDEISPRYRLTDKIQKISSSIRLRTVTKSFELKMGSSWKYFSPTSYCI